MKFLARRKGQFMAPMVLGALLMCAGSSAIVSRTYAATELVESSTLVGKTAPDFTLTDSNGKTRSLHDYKGKIVVLEWFNHGCPFVKKHYDSGNMPKLQKDYTAKGVIWLSICSSAPGKQGYAIGSEQNAVFKEKTVHQLRYYQMPPAKSGVFTERAARRRCTLSIKRVHWSMPERLMINRPLISVT